MVVITELAAGSSKVAAADAAHVARKTVYRWMDEPGFLDAVEETRAIMVEGLQGRLRGAAVAGLEALVEVARDRSAPHAARVSAGKALLDKMAPDLAHVSGEVEHSGGVRVIRITEGEKTSASKRLRAQGRQTEGVG
jgi:hypothetical protein